MNKKFEVNIVSGDAQANFVVEAISQREAILLSAEMIKNKQIKWQGKPDQEWEFISIYQLDEELFG
jgi:hypothetical protein